MDHCCIYCGDQEDISRCLKCDEAWLCPTHEEPHCGADQGECAPFKGESIQMKNILWLIFQVEQDEKSGRYLVATRDIEKVRLHLQILRLIWFPTSLPLSVCKCQSIIIMFAPNVQGSVILRDKASVLGPMITKTKLACLNCLATEGLRPCSKCKWPGR